MTPKIKRGDYNRGDPTSEVTPLERRKHDIFFIGIVAENFTINEKASIFFYSIGWARAAVKV
jgi:hypothetical protein